MGDIVCLDNRNRLDPATMILPTLLLVLPCVLTLHTQTITRELPSHHAEELRQHMEEIRADLMAKIEILTNDNVALRMLLEKKEGLKSPQEVEMDTHKAEVDMQQGKVEQEQLQEKEVVMEEPSVETALNIRASADQAAQLTVCGWKNQFFTKGATVTYDRLISDHSNKNRGGIQGKLNVSTGRFTAMTAGHYTITYSAVAVLSPGQTVNSFLYLNGRYVGLHSGFWSHNMGTAWAWDQGSRTVIVHMAVGDTMELRTNSGSWYTGRFEQVTFCLSLTASDF